MSHNNSQVDDSEVQEVLNKLWTTDSAPGAHCFVKATAENRILSADEIDEIYNSSEGYNDAATERLVKAMSRDEFESLKSEVEEEYEEYKNSKAYEEDQEGEEDEDEE